MSDDVLSVVVHIRLRDVLFVLLRVEDQDGAYVYRCSAPYGGGGEDATA